MRKSEIIYYETIEDLKQLPDGSVVHGGDSKICWFDGSITFEQDFIKQPDGLIKRSWLELHPHDTFYSWDEFEEKHSILLYTVKGDGNE